jgi:hypothetical protein
MTIRVGQYEALYNTQYLYDDKGLIMGVVKCVADGWNFRSCKHNAVPSWSDEIGPEATQAEAIKQCTVHYITRILEV